MGVDIHAFIELDMGAAEEPFSVRDDIVPYNTGTLQIPRDYGMFDALAGARARAVGGAGSMCLIRPRGLPRPVGDAVDANYYVFVVPGDIDSLVAVASDCLPSPLPFIRAADAERLKLPIERIRSRRLDASAAGLTIERTVNPDLHSVGWLFHDEILKCLEHNAIPQSGLSVPARVVILLLSQFERELGEHRARLIFWFDG